MEFPWIVWFLFSLRIFTGLSFCWIEMRDHPMNCFEARVGKNTKTALGVGGDSSVVE